MITGSVNARLEASIPLFVEDASGQTHSLEAVIDTGFSGFLSLPPAQIASLGLMWLCQEQAMLADGSIQILDVYTADIVWDSQSRRTRVTAVDSSPLVGMQLLEGSEVRIRVVPGGWVSVDSIP
jgi:clan AA aspartic protease